MFPFHSTDIFVITTFRVFKQLSSNATPMNKEGKLYMSSEKSEKKKKLYNYNSILHILNLFFLHTAHQLIVPGAWNKLMEVSPTTEDFLDDCQVFTLEEKPTSIQRFCSETPKTNQSSGVSGFLTGGSIEIKSRLVCGTGPQIYLDLKFVHRIKNTRTSWAKLKSMEVRLLHCAEGDLIKTDGDFQRSSAHA